MKNKNFWIYILVGGVAYYYIYRYWKKNSEKNFYGFVDEEIPEDYGGGNRGRGTKVEPKPADEPVISTRRKGKSS